MLFYICLSIFYILAANAKFMYDIVLRVVENKVNIKNELTQNLGYILLYTSDLALLIVIGLFFKFLKSTKLKPRQISAILYLFIFICI